MKSLPDILHQYAPCPQDFERTDPPFYVKHPRKPDCVPLHGECKMYQSPRKARYLIAVWLN